MSVPLLHGFEHHRLEIVWQVLEATFAGLAGVLREKRCRSIFLPGRLTYNAYYLIEYSTTS